MPSKFLEQTIGSRGRGRLDSVKRLARRFLAAACKLLHKQEELLAFQELMDRGLLVVGRHTYGRPKIWNYQGSESPVTIGSFCSISPHVQIITGGIHPSEWVSLYPFRLNWQLPGAHEDGMPATRGPVAIGNDVWLGTECLILSGVKIGHGSIVAARAVVTRDVPPYAIVAGCPARVVRYRFAPDVIAQMLEIAWWDWDDARIREAVSLLSSGDMTRFLDTFGCKHHEF